MRHLSKAEKRSLAAAERLQRMRETAARSFGMTVDVWMRLPPPVRRRMIEERVAVRTAVSRGRKLRRDMPEAESPAPHAHQHASYTKSKMGVDKATVAYNLTVTPLRKAEREGKITLRQLMAGEMFERTHDLVYGVAGLRSCLDITPRGVPGAVDSLAVAVVAAKSDLAAIEARVGRETYVRLVEICCDHDAIGRRNAAYLGWVRLITGLTEVADFYRLPEAE